MNRPQWIAVAESERELYQARSEPQLASLVAAPLIEQDSFPSFFAVSTDEHVELLRAAGLGVYRKPAPRRPVYRSSMRPAADSEVPQGPTADFSPLQRYLGSGPEGFDVRAIWDLPGGTGEGVSVVDIEGAWRFTHEALAGRYVTAIGPEPDAAVDFSHGTAVLGILSAASAGQGVVGIAPNARTRVACDELPHDGFRTPSQAIVDAADALQPGDIILVEVHYPGPRSAEPWHDDPDQRGFIPAEFFPDDFQAIRYAVRRGVIVVAAAGNGGENLDDAVFDDGRKGFPAWWRNPFRRGQADSGSIIVGAGACPPGTNGIEDAFPDRSRLAFSNWGSAVDAQGWGNGVTTCGYGDLQGSLDVATLDRWYTKTFNGTSSAAPCIAGVLACVQGVLRAQGRPLLTPARARTLLREIGAPQTDDIDRPRTQRIGPRPSAIELLRRAGGAV